LHRKTAHTTAQENCSYYCTGKLLILLHRKTAHTTAHENCSTTAQENCSYYCTGKLLILLHRKTAHTTAQGNCSYYCTGKLLILLFPCWCAEPCVAADVLSCGWLIHWSLGCKYNHRPFTNKGVRVASGCLCIELCVNQMWEYHMGIGAQIKRENPKFAGLR